MLEGKNQNVKEPAEPSDIKTDSDSAKRAENILKLIRSRQESKEEDDDDDF